ncbi:MAG TPA: hypothetical protein VFV50_16810, partial [Bdellovibrionales bacterium]|nr:hypothetical protein [Bdellovibrionales bacterium]
MLQKLRRSARLAWANYRINRYPSFYSSHAQFGEDMVLRSYLGDKPRGFYVDLGAHHPYYLSNTYHFYRKGWRGLNVDAAPGSMRPFQELRPRDLNVEACLGAEDGRELEFFVFDRPALNTADRAQAERLQSSGEARLVSSHKLITVRLETLLARHVP